nr:MAG TPA: Protein of unknown function (DUF551) [Caudoviricetes sp.]
MINRTKLEHILEYARQQRRFGQLCKILPEDMVEIVEIAMRKAGNSPVTPGRLPGGFTIEDAKELHEDLVRSHISQALSGEKMKKNDRDADLRWIHGVIVQAAWFVKASLEQNALSGTPPVTPAGWISCSEQMPDKLIPVMVMYEDGEMWSAMWNGNRWDDGTEYPNPHSVTHWREMPAAPKQEVNRG